MRLWHYELIPFLPKSQLVSQWRELNSIYKNQNRHILINYVYDYDKHYLYSYSQIVVDEMLRRECKINKWDNCMDYFADYLKEVKIDEMAEKHFPEHNDRYLLENFYNLQEKYYDGQKDFGKETYENLCTFIKEQGLSILE